MAVAPPATLLREALADEVGHGPSRLLPDGMPAGTRAAALINGAASHTVEFDDIYRKGIPARDPTLYLCVPSRSDPAQAPEGGEALYVLIHTAHRKAGTRWRSDLVLTSTADDREAVLYLMRHGEDNTLRHGVRVPLARQPVDHHRDDPLAPRQHGDGDALGHVRLRHVLHRRCLRLHRRPAGSSGQRVRRAGDAGQPGLTR